MILDHHGNPITTRASLSPLHDGWIRAKNLQNLQPHAVTGWEDLDRELIRKASRAAYRNPILGGAVSVIQALTLGSGITYGFMDDTRAQDALEDFWTVNDWDQKMDRWFEEFMIDGENLTRFPRNARPTEPARVGFVNVADGLELTTEDGLPDHVTSIRVGGMNGETLREGDFVWTAHMSLWNDPRGWPVVLRAIGPALAYVDFMDARVRVHQALARINAVYKAFTTTSDPQKELQAKADAYGRIPNDGHVLTLHKDMQSGQSEEFDFLARNSSAGDSQNDARALIRMVGLALGLPDHYLGIGDTGNRATAESMSEPIIKNIGRKQNLVRSYMNRLMRLELVRRHGRDRTYLVKRVIVRDNGLTRSTRNRRVPASALEFPLNFPTLRAEDLSALVRKVQLALERNLVSKQTAANELGYDYALELEHMANEGGE